MGPKHKLRSAREIARRALLLTCVASAATDASKSDLMNWLAEERLVEELTPFERKFMESRTSSVDEKNWTIWRIEAASLLLWSIRKVDKINDLTRTCNGMAVYEALPKPFCPTSQFISSAVRRPNSEIFAEAGRVIEAGQAIQKASQGGVPTSIPYDGDVFQERWVTVTWLLRPKESWDTHMGDFSRRISRKDSA